MSYDVARALSQIQYAVSSRYRTALIQNLTVALESMATRRDPAVEARRAFENFAYCVTDFLQLSALSSVDLETRFEVTGYDAVRELQKAGTGVIIMSAHLGCWELGGALLAGRGHRIHGVARQHADARVNRFFVETRKRAGIEVLAPGSASMRLVDRLQAGGIVGLLADRDVADCGLETEFFGRRTVLPRGHASLAARSGVPIVPAFAVQRTRGYYHLTFEAPIELSGTGSVRTRIGLMVERCARILERTIRNHPDQWYAFHPIWKSEARVSGASSGLCDHSGLQSRRRV
jgi:KDO2-lipid IV(A) lauroyltransferase